MGQYKQLIKFLVFTTVLILCLIGLAKADTPGDFIVKVVNLPGTSEATAFFLNVNGEVRIITNAHVCHALTSSVGVITFEAPSTEPASLVYVKRISVHYDLCELSGAFMRDGLTLGQGMQINEPVTSIGYPRFGHQTLTRGHYLKHTVSGTIHPELIARRCFGISFFYNPLDRHCYQYQNAEIISNDIQPGDSGSPVLNLNNEVVGVIYGHGLKGQSGFALSVDALRDFLAGN